MNAADLARLELAKRAYRSVEPSAAEVQRGVRKARLALRRPRQRRAWFTKTLVAVVLAMGGLAFAKPQALGEWVETALRSGASASPKRAGGAGSAAEAALTPRLLADGPSALTAGVPLAPAAQPQPAPADPQPAKPAAGPLQGPKSSLASAPALSLPQRDQAGKLDKAGTAPAVVASNAQPEGAEAGISSEWGRVGEALARGDEPRAMAALKELSHSEDPRTRDKADLGRAQLLMGNGNRDQACAMARSLTNRRAGGRIERQAQVLLKSCKPKSR
ncbi:MAG TPA: hypothetical protein VJN18_15890 [Polyangiaceae bacterium]|nr:hypothetical protein [Polyangiaceae bacterium]